MKKLLALLFARLKEPSTHSTLFAALAFFSVSLPPETLTGISQILVGVSMVGTAALGLILPEKKA